jgi:hypothetical protein
LSSEYSGLHAIIFEEIGFGFPPVHCFLVVVIEKDALYDTYWLEIIRVVLNERLA